MSDGLIRDEFQALIFGLSLLHQLIQLFFALISKPERSRYDLLCVIKHFCNFCPSVLSFLEFKETQPVLLSQMTSVRDTVQDVKLTMNIELLC